MIYKKGDIVQLVSNGCWSNNGSIGDGAKGQCAEFQDYTGGQHQGWPIIHLKLLAPLPGQFTQIVLTSEDRIKKL